MSHILKRKINNVIYVYQEKSYRDKLGRPRTKQKCLGKLDNNGVLILSKKRNPKNLPAAITKYNIVITKFRVKVITDSLKDNRPENSQSQANKPDLSRKPARTATTRQHALRHYAPVSPSHTATKRARLHTTHALRQNAFTLTTRTHSQANISLTFTYKKFISHVKS